jgi:hypothetical protein
MAQLAPSLFARDSCRGALPTRILTHDRSRGSSAAAPGSAHGRRRAVTRVMHAAALAEELHTRPAAAPTAAPTSRTWWRWRSRVLVLVSRRRRGRADHRAAARRRRGPSRAPGPEGLRAWPRPPSVSVRSTWSLASFGRTVVERLELLTNPDFDSHGSQERFGAIAGADLAQRKAQLYMPSTWPTRCTRTRGWPPSSWPTSPPTPGSSMVWAIQRAARSCATSTAR